MGSVTSVQVQSTMRYNNLDCRSLMKPRYYISFALNQNETLLDYTSLCKACAFLCLVGTLLPSLLPSTMSLPLEFHGLED